MSGVAIKLSLPYSEASGRALADVTDSALATFVPAARLRRGRYRLPIAGTEVNDFRHEALVTLSGLARRASVVGAQRLATGLMYRGHERFDSSVAARADIFGASVLIAYPGAAIRTAVAVAPATRLVLNAVNGTPELHNAAVREGGAPPNHHELVPARVAAHVHREYAMAHLVLSPSQRAAAAIERLGVPADRIGILPYGRPSAQARMRLDSPKAGRPIVLYVGQISYRKGILLLFEIARRLVHLCDFRLMGPVVARELLSFLPTNCAYLGEGSLLAVEAQMDAASALVLPTYEDTYGLVVSEALTRGLPVVVSNRAGSHEDVLDRAGYVVAEQTPEAYVTRLEALLKPDAWGDHAKGAFLAGQKIRTWPHYVDQVLALIERSLS